MIIDSSKQTIGKIIIGTSIIGGSFLGFQVYKNAPHQIQQNPSIAVCDSIPHHMQCQSRIITNTSGEPVIQHDIEPATLPAGFGGSQLNQAYELPTTTAIKPIPIIAVVDAYDDPWAYSDLTYNSKTFGLPLLPQCLGDIVSSNVPCFKKINQTGGSSISDVKIGSSWILEISLDIQTAHMICQNCKILLVESRDSDDQNVYQAVDTAVAKGAKIVSMSFTANGEDPTQIANDFHFNHPGVAFVGASGDAGFLATYPSSSPYVISAGGTTLTTSNAGSWSSETVWSGTGSGCSLYEPKPSYQTDSGCTNRTQNDVAADGDPNTGVAIYDSYGSIGSTGKAFDGGWFQVGGTSLATPIIAAIYALEGVPSAPTYAATTIYNNTNLLHDITVGSNTGGSCSPAYLCHAEIGFDGPTGWGTPFGTGAF